MIAKRVFASVAWISLLAVCPQTAVWADADCQSLADAFKARYKIDAHDRKTLNFYIQYCSSFSQSDGLSIRLPTLDIGFNSSQNSQACASSNYNYFEEFSDQSASSFLNSAEIENALGHCQDGLFFYGREDRSGISLQGVFRDGGSNKTNIESIKEDPPNSVIARGDNALVPGKEITPEGIAGRYTRSPKEDDRDIVFQLNTPHASDTVRLPGAAKVDFSMTVATSGTSFSCQLKITGSTLRPQTVPGSATGCAVGPFSMKACGVISQIGSCYLRYGVGFKIPIGTRTLEPIKPTWEVKGIQGNGTSFECYKDKKLIGLAGTVANETEFGKLAKCAGLYSK